MELLYLLLFLIEAQTKGRRKGAISDTWNG